MDRSRISGSTGGDSLTRQVADTITVDSNQLLMFSDATDALAALLGSIESGPSKVIAVGYATPSVEMAVDRAGFELVECHGPSPFAGDIGSVSLDGLAPNSLIYAANPNRTTGAALMLEELRSLAEMVPDGLLIIDEHYHEFLGTSAVELIGEHSNIAVLRSFTAGFSIGSEAGFVVGSEPTIDLLRGDHSWQRMSVPLTNIVTTMLASETAQTQQLQMIYDESLRLSGLIASKGIQVRLAPSDFLMFRVEDPARVCNHFASCKQEIDNMHGYPGLENYLRYEIQSPLSNDQFLRALETTPSEILVIRKLDKRPIRLLRRSEFKVGENRSASDLTESVTSVETVVAG